MFGHPVTWALLKSAQQTGLVALTVAVEAG